MIDELLDSDYFDKKEAIEKYGGSPSDPAVKAEMNMEEIAEERRAQGLPPD